MSVRENLIEKVLRIIDQVRENRFSIHNSSQQQTTLPLATVDAYLMDVQAQLCNLMSCMIASPLTGVVSLAKPQAYVTEDQRVQSLFEAPVPVFDGS
jgi:hypothetical protein